MNIFAKKKLANDLNLNSGMELNQRWGLHDWISKNNFHFQTFPIVKVGKGVVFSLY